MISNQDFHKAAEAGIKNFKKSFLDSEFKDPGPDNSLFHILPAPLESSVSYGTGTAMAPEAVINASSQLEAWDGFSVPGKEGIHTCRQHIRHLTGSNSFKSSESPGYTEFFLGLLEKEVAKTLGDGSIPVIIGGEHTVSLSAFRAVSKTGISTGIVQFDAHADLRDKYENNHLSHACVMKRGFDLGFPIFQAGVRSLSEEEFNFRENNSIHHIDALQAVTEKTGEIKLPDGFPLNIYITIDVDGFDPSVFPGTGTPEPGGLGWYQVLSMIQSISRDRRIIGFDVVEVSPREDTNISEFTAARLIYNIMGIISRTRGKR